MHEAKGQDCESFVLFRFISGKRAAFDRIAEGVDPADVASPASDTASCELDYRRARGRTDKSLELHKIHVNAPYVALAWAVRHLDPIESDLKHSLLGLPGLEQKVGTVEVVARASSLDGWSPMRASAAARTSPGSDAAWGASTASRILRRASRTSCRPASNTGSTTARR